MSFSKAKIRRFNDDIPCAPPPGAYNPGKVDKSVGPKIHKSERFTENYTFLIHASSTESVNSVGSEKGTSSAGNFATFKTPKIPSTYRTIPRTDIAMKGSFSLSKAASTDYINKKSNHKECVMNPLKYGLHMLQDELTNEKNKNQELVAELKHLKVTTDEAEDFSEYLVDTVVEKNSFIDLLTEKCRTLQLISVESFESYQSYIKNMHEVLREHCASSSKTDSDIALLIDRYETLVAQYERDIESASEQCSLVLETLKKTERERKRYEIMLQGTQEVINVLKGRVRESDVEVEKTYQVISTLNEERTKLGAILRSKEEEIIEMRDVVESMSKKFSSEVRDTENNLYKLIDEFKERANIEEEKYRADLKSKNEMILDLVTSKNEKELQLQEALDEIELLKCREENLRQSLDRTQAALHERHVRFQNAYDECRERLRDLERTYKQNPGVENTENLEEMPTDLISCTPMKFEESIKLEDRPEFQKFDGVEELEEGKSVSEKPAMQDCDIDVARLHEDYIHKCWECGQLTKFLQLCENKLELADLGKAALVESNEKLEAEFETQKNHLKQLESENFNLRQQLASQSLARESESIIEDKTNTNEIETDAVTTEFALKEERMKNEELQKRIAALETLIGKLEAEKKSLAKDDSKTSAQKNSKRLTERNQEMKSKTAVLQPQKNARDSVRKSSLLTQGKENEVNTRNNEVRKTVTAEAPLNATYIVSSPKVSRI